MKDEAIRVAEQAAGETRKDVAVSLVQPFIDQYKAGIQDNREALSDVLTDLRHWADENGVDWNECITRADIHFNAETD